MQQIIEKVKEYLRHEKKREPTCDEIFEAIHGAGLMFFKEWLTKNEEDKSN